MSETARNPFAPTTVAVYCLDGPDSLPKRKAAAGGLVGGTEW